MRRTHILIVFILIILPMYRERTVKPGKLPAAVLCPNATLLRYRSGERHYVRPSGYKDRHFNDL